MSVYSPQYGVTESMETKAIESKVMIRLNPHDIIKNAIQTKAIIAKPEFVEFADNGDLIFRATVFKPVPETK